MTSTIIYTNHPKTYPISRIKGKKAYYLCKKAYHLYRITQSPLKSLHYLQTPPTDKDVMDHVTCYTLSVGMWHV